MDDKTKKILWDLFLVLIGFMLGFLGNWLYDRFTKSNPLVYSDAYMERHTFKDLKEFEDTLLWRAKEKLIRENFSIVGAIKNISQKNPKIYNSLICYVGNHLKFNDADYYNHRDKLGRSCIDLDLAGDEEVFLSQFAYTTPVSFSLDWKEHGENKMKMLDSILYVQKLIWLQKHYPAEYEVLTKNLSKEEISDIVFLNGKIDEKNKTYTADVYKVVIESMNCGHFEIGDNDGERRKGQDDSGKQAEFEFIYISNSFFWQLGSLDTIENISTHAIVSGESILASPEMKKYIENRKLVDLVCIGAASEETNSDGNEDREIKRAYLRASQLGYWFKKYYTSTTIVSENMYSLNLGIFKDKKAKVSSESQRRMIIIGVTSKESGVDLSEALKDAFERNHNIPISSYSSFELKEYDEYDFKQEKKGFNIK